MTEFTKDMLKTGMEVTLRNGIKYVCFRDTAIDGFEADVFVSRNQLDWARFSEYTEDGYSSGAGFRHLDIMEVRTGCHPYFITQASYEKYKATILWKREEKAEKQLEYEKLMSKVEELQQKASELLEQAKKLEV
jgi:hypothetical protein